MKRTFFSIILSLTGLLLASFSFSGEAQLGNPVLPDGLSMPETLASFPGASHEWWEAVQAQLSEELGAQPDLSATPDWSAVGETTENYFGYPVASLGDVNGDGYADLAIGATGYNSNTGKVYVYHGSSSGLSASSDWSAVGEDFDNFFGLSVASAGDVNADGYSDLAVGADNYNFMGKAYIYYGSAGGLSAIPDWSAVGENNSGFGFPVASAGDVNGDGYSDLAVGAQYHNNWTGKAYVYHGSAGGLSASPDWSAVGEAVDNFFGFSVASAGDVKGDGYSDLTVGAPGYNSVMGKAYVYHGSAGGLSLTADWTAVGETTSNNVGESVASAGDVNGDGYSDLAVGAPGYNSYTGKAYVYHGSAGGLSLTPDWSAVGEAANNLFGQSVASAGDVNSDGFSDLAVGATGHNSVTGKAYFYHGSAGGLSATPDWTAVGEATLNGFGLPVASAGDVNGDGYADLAVGAPYQNSSTGKAYVYHGSATPAGCTSSCLRVTEIEMRIDLKNIYASVTITDENGAAVPRAAVSAQWDLPGGSTLDQTKITDASGSASFIVKGRTGTYTITITNVALAGYTFDPDNSAILSKSIMK